jgi:hypothetical protein
MLSNNQTDKDSGPEYPEPFVSDVMSTGSMTVDNGMIFTLEVDDSGFHLQKDYGVWSVSDLFGEMNWWPTDLAWLGQNANLLGLLDALALKVGVAATELLDIVREYLEEYGGDADIQAYLTDERSQSFSLARLRRKHAELVGNFRIPGLPSDDFEEGSSYRGLDLAFGTDGWSAILWEPSVSDRLFQSDSWDGDTLNEILDHLPWKRDKLVEILVEDDPCWKHFIDTDFSIVEESEHKSPPELRPESPPKPTPSYSRRVANDDWEKEEFVVVVDESGEVLEDTLVIGRRPEGQSQGGYYLYLKSKPVLILRRGASGYGAKTIYELKQKLNEELAKEGMSFGRQD